jgi:O-antigen/teichoic acid export membrane protein
MSRRLSYHALLLAFASAAGQLALVGVFALLGRLDGPAAIGIISIALSVGAISASLIDFGANSLWARELSAGRMTPEGFAQRAGSKIFVGLVAAGLIAFVCLLAPGGLAKHWGASVVLASLLLTQTLQVPVRAQQKNVALALCLLLDKCLMIGSFFSISLFVGGTTAFYLSYLLGSCVDAACLCFVAGAKYLPRLHIPSVPSAWGGSRYYGLSGVLVAAAGLDLVIASALGGASVAGTYGAVNRWTQPIGLATNSFTTLALPVIAGAADRHDVWRRVRGSLWLPVASIAFAIGLGVLAGPLVSVVMGPQFSDSVTVLRILCLGAAIGTANQILQTVLQARRRDRVASYVVLVGVIVQLGLVGPLTIAMGAIGVALAMVASQIIFLAGFLICLRAALGESGVIGRLHETSANRKLPGTGTNSDDAQHDEGDRL